jgi:separase
MTRSGAKSEWWAEREALDARLRDLLQNIENIWLGGFRGIFCQFPRQPELLSRFQSSFQKILDKHLPSRQKMGKRNKTGCLNLDPRILELFVGLGNPEEAKCDLDEPLTDLLYFVVDVLQFHGERNAYDEIDFDAVSFPIVGSLV